MTLFQLFKNIYPFVKPYRWLIVGTLALTLVGSMAAQVNALVLQYTVDAVNRLVEAGKGMLEGASILLWITV
ncbi:MAG: ABC transporter, partial [Tannerella sp.]|nr:ABC transporter [Tannerella sp.]